jgi:shikimate kinase
MAEVSKPVFLIGFMGSGKTTFGKKLATKLHLSFIDLDESIISSEKKTIEKIVLEHGMEYFRNIETATLKSLNISGKLISTGGGTPCFHNNIDWMKETGIVVYLQVDEGVLFSRLKQTDLNHRPLLKGLDEGGLKKYISETLKEREPIYKQAHIAFNPVKEPMEILVEKLKNKDAG